MTFTSDFLNEVRDSIKTKLVNDSQYGAVGTGTTSELPSDTSLESEVSRVPIVESTQGANSVFTSVLFNSTVANGNDLTEAGLFVESSAGDMVNRVTFPAITKTASVDVFIDFESIVNVTQ